MTKSVTNLSSMRIDKLIENKNRKDSTASNPLVQTVYDSRYYHCCFCRWSFIASLKRATKVNAIQLLYLCDMFDKIYWIHVLTIKFISIQSYHISTLLRFETNIIQTISLYHTKCSNNQSTLLKWELTLS